MHLTHPGFGGTTGTASQPVVREVGTVMSAALVYFGVRYLVEGDTPTATANAERIVDLESRLGIDLERTAQDVVLDHSWVRFAANVSYVWFHWPLLIVVMIVLFQRNPLLYVRLRRAIVTSGAVGLLLFWLMPTAPPRFMPGYVGTVSDAARRHYLGYPLSWANKYASFPSFHVGWTLIACVALAMTLPSVRARITVMLPAGCVALAVVTTGNHYVVDAAAGAVFASAAFVLWRPSPIAHAATERSEFVERPDVDHGDVLAHSSRSDDRVTELALAEDLLTCSR